MAVKDHVLIRITVEEITKKLQQHLHFSAHSELIAKVVVGQLARTEVGLEQLYKSFEGIEPSFKYPLKAQVYLPTTYTYSWKLDKVKMEEADLLFQDHVKGVIVDRDEFRADAYRLEYSYIESGTGEQKVETIWIKEEYLKSVSRYPLDQ